MAKKIPLSQGLFATIDDQDFEWLNQWNWYAHKHGNTVYAERMEGLYPNQKVIRMHQQITNVPTGLVVDHKDRNGLNNRRNNLRVCTHSENTRNDNLQRNNTTGFKGVSPLRGKFQASIKVNYKQIYLGIYETPEDAARAYDEAAKKYFGEYARTNF